MHVVQSFGEFGRERREIGAVPRIGSAEVFRGTALSLGIFDAEKRAESFPPKAIGGGTGAVFQHSIADFRSITMRALLPIEMKNSALFFAAWTGFQI